MTPLIRKDLSALSTAIPYIKAFKGKTFVVKMGGDLCESERAIHDIIEQITLLQQLGINVVLVHGGGKHSTKLAESLGIKTEFVNGRRITSSVALEVLKMSFLGTLNTNILLTARKIGLSAVGLSGIDADLIVAHRRGPVSVKTDQGTETVDFGHVGEIDSVNTTLLKNLISDGLVPVIASLGATREGEALNINADTIAAYIAVALGAEKLIYTTTVDGVFDDINNPATLHSVLTQKEIESMRSKGLISEGMLPKLETALWALERGVNRVHIVSGFSEDSILHEAFTNEGAGTMITKE
ncbi:acetylglutamate kinase [bacterium]|nr:acetylglutamate kinase [bacterium]